ncbi:MAG: cytochrome c [Pseudomonadota bacterium]
MRHLSLGWVGLAVFAVVFVIASVAAVDRAGKPIARADPDDAKAVETGRIVYAAQCAACHGAQLEGQPNWQTVGPNGKVLAPPHDATGHSWQHTDGELFRMTKFSVADIAPKGYVSDMPAFADRLSDDQIWAVLAYIKSRWPRDIRAYQAMITNPTAAQAALLGDGWRFPPLCVEPSRALAADRQQATRPATAALGVR